MAPGWRVAHIGVELDDFSIGGVEIWKAKWRRTGLEAADLPHPAYPNQQHRYEIYEVGDPDRPVRFAAAELSANVWGFYVPTWRALKTTPDSCS